MRIDFEGIALEKKRRVVCGQILNVIKKRESLEQEVLRTKRLKYSNCSHLELITKYLVASNYGP